MRVGSFGFAVLVAPAVRFVFVTQLLQTRDLADAARETRKTVDQRQKSNLALAKLGTMNKAGKGDADDAGVSSPM